MVLPRSTSIHLKSSPGTSPSTASDSLWFLLQAGVRYLMMRARTPHTRTRVVKHKQTAGRGGQPSRARAVAASALVRVGPAREYIPPQQHAHAHMRRLRAVITARALQQRLQAADPGPACNVRAHHRTDCYVDCMQHM